MQERGGGDQTLIGLSQRDAMKWMNAKNVPGFTDELIDTYARKVEGDPSLAQEVIDSLMNPTAGQQFLQAGSSAVMQPVHLLETKVQVMFESVNCLSQNVQALLKNVEKQEEVMTRHMEKQEEMMTRHSCSPGVRLLHAQLSSRSSGQTSGKTAQLAQTSAVQMCRSCGSWTASRLLCRRASGRTNG